MTRRFILAALALACVVSSAMAAEVASAPIPAVVVPYGDWIVAIADTATQVLLPILVTVITAAIARVAPWAALFLSQRRVEAMVQSITDYALNAIDGATKGKVLEIPIGSAVIAKAVQRALDVAPKRVVAAAGGPAGIAERVFRTLHLEAGATAANVLAPAIAALPGRR